MKYHFTNKFKKYLDGDTKIVRDLFNDQNHVVEAKKHILAALPFWIAGIITAILATFYAHLFSYVEKKAILLYSNLGLWALFVVPILFVLSWYIVERFAPFANGSGIPQLMAAAEISQENPKSLFIQKLLGIRIIVVKIISSLLGVLGGGAIGREGPTLQIAGSVFHLAGKFLPKGLLIKNHHSLILAGGAAGLASAFNTPLGGLVYVVEELSKSHLSTFRTGILHAVIVAGLISQLLMGPYLYFGYPKIEIFRLEQIGTIIGVSILVGLLAVFFSQTLKLVVIYRARLKTPVRKAILAAFCGLLFAGYALFGSQSVIGSGKELLNGLLFDGKQTNLLYVFSRFFGSIITYSAGGAGGIFAPTLSIGGAAASYITTLFGSDLGILGVLVGMTAALSALTQSPFTSFVLILEMTDRHGAIFPLMIAALLGQGISKFVSKNSFYDFVCHRILTGRESLDEQ